MGMNGFVRSRRPAGVYCMKRHINPGQKVSLDELYDQYGISHDIPSGPPFVRWLRTVKLGRRDIWEIMYNDMSIVSGEEPFEALRKAEEARIVIEAAEKEALRKAEEASDWTPVSGTKVPEELEVEAEKTEKTEEAVEVEVPKEKISGKVNLEGDIKVDDSDGVSFSFPSEKPDFAKRASEINERRFNTIKAKSGSVKAVRARSDGIEKPSITPADILELKITDFDKLDKVDDLRILKIALKQAEDMRNKTTLCKRLKARISRLKPRSRFGSV